MKSCRNCEYLTEMIDKKYICKKKPQVSNLSHFPYKNTDCTLYSAILLKNSVSKNHYEDK